jgi:hypothetical protein
MELSKLKPGVTVEIDVRFTPRSDARWLSHIVTEREVPAIVGSGKLLFSAIPISPAIEWESIIVVDPSRIRIKEEG